LKGRLPDSPHLISVQLGKKRNRALGDIAVGKSKEWIAEYKVRK